MIREIPYQKLKTFCYVATEKSFKRAAARLYVTAGAVSLQMTELEAQLEKKLFEGSKRRAELTSDGLNLFNLAAPIVEKCETIGLEFERMSGTVVGEVKIASFTAMFLHILLDNLKKFERLYPECEIILANVSGKEIRSMVISGEADFGIGSVTSLPDDLIGKELWSFERFFIAPKGHPLSKLKGVTYRDMSHYPIVMADHGGTGGSQLERSLRSFNPNLKVTMDAISWEVVIKCVELGYGVSVAPSFVIQPKDRKRLHVSNITRSDETAGLSRYGILVKKGKYLTPAARELIKFLAPEFDPWKELWPSSM
ncbi:MAG: LysR family transcriptional regulator [Syntrophorhabdales bacterium]